MSETYFPGSTKEEQKFVEHIRLSAKEQGFNRFQMWRLERRLSKPAFVKAVVDEYKSEAVWDNPDGSPAQIDWSNIDWNQVFSIVMQLLKLFM